MKLYVVVNSDGHFFRSKGFGGYGKTWVAELEGARFYTKLGQAKSRVTWFARTYPQYPAPSIVFWEIVSQFGTVVEMGSYAKNAIKKIEDRKEKDRLKRIDYEIKRLEEQKIKSDAQIIRLRNATSGPR